MQLKLIFLFLFFTLHASAQVKFVSQNVKNIYDQLPALCKKQLIENNECECLLKGSYYHLRLETNGNVISNVGLKVFKDTADSFISNSINSFVGREFLKFILDDNEARESRRKEDQVYIYYANSFQEFSLLETTESISKVISDISGITIKQDSLKYKVLITNSHGEKIGMEFPAINSLISGMDKKELDEYLVTELLKIILPGTSKPPTNHDLSFKQEGDLLVEGNEIFMLKEFSSNKYYVNGPDGIKLVFDKKYVKESFSNLFLTGSSASNTVSIDITIKCYGKDDKIPSITIDKLLSHFGTQFKLFFGIEDTCSDHLRGTLLIYNPALNYLHLLDIKTDLTHLFGNPIQLSATLYPYIPTHNIKDLFGAGEKTKAMSLDDLLNGKTN